MSLVAGLGSPHGDDQLGWVAIDQLERRLPPAVAAHKVRDGLELLDFLAGHDTAILIDAAAPAGRPGLIRTFAWPCPELAQSALWSSHGLGLAEALHLAEAIGHLPPHVFIYTIEARDIAPGGCLSDDVARQLDVLVDLVLAETGRCGCPA